MMGENAACATLSIHLYEHTVVGTSAVLSATPAAAFRLRSLAPGQPRRACQGQAQVIKLACRQGRECYEPTDAKSYKSVAAPFCLEDFTGTFFFSSLSSAHCCTKEDDSELSDTTGRQKSRVPRLRVLTG